MMTRQTEKQESREMKQTAYETLGMSWDTEAETFDGGDGNTPLAYVDLTEQKILVEDWRERDIAGDREAESDWDDFCSAVKEAKAAAMAAPLKSTWNAKEGYRRTISASRADKLGLAGSMTCRRVFAFKGCEHCGATEAIRMTVRQYWFGDTSKTAVAVYCSKECAKREEVGN